MKTYDYLIVGAGLFGSVCAYELSRASKSCLVIDKRNHIGGNVYCESVNGINVHKYGAHIFHTSNKTIWDYVNSFIEFNRYTNYPIANFKGKLFNLPFNMNTFYQMWGTITPDAAKAKIEAEVAREKIGEPKNLEEKALSLVGRDIYETLIKGYTEKQWGCKCSELPPFIISRLPLRFTFDNNYFNDRYQGIPIGGYNKLFEKLLSNVDLKLNCDFFDNKELANLTKRIIYTGPIDRLLDFKLGRLEYRGLHFDTRIEKTDNFQGSAVVNYTSSTVPYTRIIEHKHFESTPSNETIITYEYPKRYVEGAEPYYPINNPRNDALYANYENEIKKTHKFILGGRLATYKYLDMHCVIQSALETVNALLKNN
ncbi:MAG: UDP-galactopyranose mutase [Christensenellaceae bacterium]|jgi:UDP-galactopyranose mutase|nr:UDP-galactopyranose mutase [Christensenellaceae bacterium]